MRARNLSFLVTVSAFGLIGATPGYAQTAAAPPATAQPTDAVPPVDEEMSEEVIVTGFRSAETKEISSKKNSIEISDGISSDDLGRIPDLNIGEAMQRIPGIQINREGEGRDASVSLRGLPGEYARTTLNGVSFAEPILQGATPFGAFLSDVFSGVRIEKSQLAHSLAGGLSGNIDLEVAPALSRKDGLRLKAALDYNELGKRKEPNFTIGLDKKITDNFAVFGTFAYKKENFRRDGVLISAYGVLTPQFPVAGGATGNTSNITTLTGTPNFSRYLDYYAPQGSCAAGGANASVVGCASVAGGTGLKSKTGVLYPNQTRNYERINKGTQYSASGGMEWKPDDKWTLGVVGLYTNRKQSDTTQSFQTLVFNGSGAIIDPTSEVKPGANGTYYVDSFNFQNVNNITDNRLLPVTQRAWGVNGTIDFEDDKWRAKTTGTYSKAFSSAREQYISISKPVQGGILNGAPVIPNGANGSFASGSGDWDAFSLVQPNGFVVSTLVPKTAWTPQVLQTAPYPNLQNPPGTQAPTNYSNYFDSAANTPGRTQFRITGTQSEAGSTLMALQQDFEHKFEWGPFSAVQAGLRWEQTKFTSAGSKVSGIGINPTAIGGLQLVTNPDAGNFFQGSLPGASQAWKIIDVDAAFKAIGPAALVDNPTTANDERTTTTLNENGLYNEYADDNNVGRFNFTNKTDVMSAYAEAKLDTTIAGMSLKGSFGMRYEATTRKQTVLSRFKAYTNPIGSLADFSPTPVSEDYDYWLPSGILVLEPTRNVLVRFAAYKTYVRPHPRQFSPVTLVGQPDLSNVRTVTLGNPALKPYTANSYDISLEWYNRPGGLISVAAYQKDITGLIQQISGAQNICPADGGGLGLGPLRLSGTSCEVINGDRNGSGQVMTVNITGTVNSDTPIKVRGLEANVKQNFDFLPSFLSHLGGGVSYGYTQIRGTLPNGQKASLAGVSKHNLNLIGYYETKLAGLRLTYNFRSAYDVPDQVIFGFGGAARRVSPRGQLDGSFTLNLNDQISLNLSAFNITNAVRKEYQGIEEMARRIDYDGRSYRVAVNAKF